MYWDKKKGEKFGVSYPLKSKVILKYYKFSTRLYHFARFHARDCRNNVHFNTAPWLFIKIRGKQCKEVNYEQEYAPRLRKFSQWAPSKTLNQLNPIKTHFYFFMKISLDIFYDLNKRPFRSVTCALRLVFDDVLIVRFPITSAIPPQSSQATYPTAGLTGKTPYRANSTCSKQRISRGEIETGYETGACGYLLMEHISRWLTFEYGHSIHYVLKFLINPIFRKVLIPSRFTNIDKLAQRVAKLKLNYTFINALAPLLIRMITMARTRFEAKKSDDLEERLFFQLPWCRKT